MDSEYDHKFEDMKKYIPFLENMIKRLESTSSPSNPRQAQLDKIRSLRDLLQDKKKRMKMDNLLKCEQVLINLYKKVEQKDSFEEIDNIAEKPTNDTDLNTVRNKLKSVVLKLNEDTLPEIARASETEEVCVPGSKEPALFQRRPNRPTSPNNSLDSNIAHQNSKRSYTRVLMSPEPSSSRWRGNEYEKADLPIFSRRSPKTSPQRYSPSYHKRERKKNYKKSKHSKDLNITLNVPEEKLNSLNTKDILSRIINCSDKDVDITTLRELRSQILGELKQTGANDDISDLLIKSYEKTDYNKRDKKDDVEEGELSDSESEAIESIYGSLVIMDKNNKSSHTTKKQSEEDSRKIQICLVINSDKSELKTNKPENAQSKDIDISDFETFAIEKKCDSDKTIDICSSKVEVTELARDENVSKMTKSAELNDKEDKITKSVTLTTSSSENYESKKNITTSVVLQPTNAENFILNHQQQKMDNNNALQHQSDINFSENKPVTINKIADPARIPLLQFKGNEKINVVSEIDILQALKKEILDETNTVLGSDTLTPALHQPKLNKVANTPKPLSKKIITIEKYKEKSNSSPNTLFFQSKREPKDDGFKKQSLKLTEKEYERFNLPPKISFNESSEEETSSISLDDVYDDLAPKSPDHEDFADAGIKPPVIIPSDPIKPSVVSSIADIDMRNNVPNVSPANILHNISKINPMSIGEVKEKTMPQLVDPRRVRREQQLTYTEKTCDSALLPYFSTTTPSSTSDISLTTNSINSPIPYSNPEMTPCRTLVAPNMTPVFIPNMTPNARSFDQAFDSDDLSGRKHVYAPMFSDVNSLHNHDLTALNQRDADTRAQVWEENSISPTTRDVDYRTLKDGYRKDFRCDRYRLDRRDNFKRNDCPQTLSHSFGRIDCPSTPVPSFGRADSSLYPTTQSPAYVRPDMPMTPIHPFGRSDGSATPLHSFSRSDGSATPIHSFGRSEGPSTPSHSFGRSECPSTPSHCFGRSEYTQKQHISQSKYGRVSNPRLNRSYECDNYLKRDEDRDRGYYREHKYVSSFNSNQRSSYSYKRFGRDETERNNDMRFHDSDNNYKGRKSRRDLSTDQLSNRDELISHNRNYNERYSQHKQRLSGDKSSSENDKLLNKNKKLSTVLPTGENSFTIDTSINSTFQNLANENNFDSRRQRAASVGRTLNTEVTVARTIIKDKIDNQTSNTVDQKRDFRRASSVGREMLSKCSENFKDVKDDLRSFKFKSELYVEDSLRSRCLGSINVEKKDTNIYRSNQHGSKSNFNDKYQYKGNCRTASEKANIDPRQRREMKLETKNNSYGLSKNKLDQKVNNRSISRDPRISGIVYSDDNISKGKLLGPDYVVKNYKIPKIKRSPEETVSIENLSLAKKEQEEVNDAKNNLKNKDEVLQESRLQDNSRNKVSNTQEYQCDKINKEYTEDSKKVDTLNSPKRITRSAKRKESIGIQNKLFTQKKEMSKNSIVHEDSDTNETKQNNTPKKFVMTNECSDDLKPMDNINDENKLLDSDIKLNPKSINSATTLDSEGIKTKTDLNSSFGDLEIFSDNIVCDPVLDNINALIADLDNDLDGTKVSDQSNQFMQEISLENMMEKITSPDDINSQNQVLNSNTEIIESGLESQNKNSEENESLSSESFKESCLINDSENRVVNNKSRNTASSLDASYSQLETTNIIRESNLNVTVDDMKVEEKDKEINPVIGRTEENINMRGVSTIANYHVASDDSNEAIVSTTKDENRLDSSVHIIGEQNVSNLNVPIPDSTNNISEANNSEIDTERCSENTIEQSDSNNHVTSSLNISKTLDKDPNQFAEQNDVGKLLSILKDKTKIRELLTLLEGQAEDNEKIKRKLEKLSEIVMDDNDDDMEAIKNDNVGQLVKTGSLQNTNTVEEVNEKKSDSENVIKDINEEEKLHDIVRSVNSENEEILTKEDAHIHNEMIDSSDTKSVDEDKSLDKQNASEAIPVNKAKAKNKPRKGKVKKNKKTNKKQPVTRPTNVTQNSSFKRPSRELLKLQKDIQEMFIKDDILNCTSSIRMCRIAKLVDEKLPSQVKESAPPVEYEPIVRLEKFKNVERLEPAQEMEKNTNKKCAKSKNKKFKTIASKIKKGNAKKICTQEDPYLFETDSISDTANVGDKKYITSEYESDSADSTKSTEPLSEIKKKPKRKRLAWQAGVIVPKHKKKKKPTKKTKQISSSSTSEISQGTEEITPDVNCYIDKLYCFVKNINTYNCRLCNYMGDEIVYHYKNRHPHTEIPLSRMSPDVAADAIKQCEKVNFQIVSKLQSKRYVCRFCFKEFARNKNILETFFWHVVSVHTGEYKNNCTACDINKCPFELDIPPPPKNLKGQLIGYVCGNCNYTQISLENLKSHVIRRHNDEQTEVYTINLGYMSQKTLNAMTKEFTKNKFSNEPDKARVLRSNRSTSKVSCIRNDTSSESDASNNYDDASNSSNFVDNTNIEKEIQPIYIQSKIAFENDNIITSASVKEEPNVDLNQSEGSFQDTPNEETYSVPEVTPIDETQKGIFELAHFKVRYKESGNKEYVCCVNNEKHYTTTLLISFKKHVQVKHKEIWDGYCCLCKVIVTSQGNHKFSECLQHFLDKHFDNFPVLEDNEAQESDRKTTETVAVEQPPIKSYLTLRPLSELISVPDDRENNSSPLPIIESVVSLVTENSTPISYPRRETEQVEKQYLYEEAQAEIMRKKHRIVLNAMMSHEKLAHVFKCAGRFCSFTTDNAEDALLHATTHSRVGGDNALQCSYCDYDASDNAIDLITHVFKTHGCCQFACGFCFYRAAATQLVNAHIIRMHADVRIKTVLKANFSTDQCSDDSVLSREIAVPFYYCSPANSENESSCKFRTYTPGKFCEHLSMRHSDLKEYMCFICQVTMSTPSELIQHIKSHGLKLYQCTWCVFGADNEADLLAHASAKHPIKQPKAYLRVITNKEGSAEYRVLPLAHLNKSSIPTVDLLPKNTKENPVREAERSVDLEKLIGGTNSNIEPMTSLTPTGDPVPETTTENNEKAVDYDDIIPRAVTPEMPIAIDQQSTPVIKHEENNTTEKRIADPNEVVCLDSDDENQTSAPVVQEEPTTSKTAPQTELLKLPLPLLYMCSQCNTVSKNPTNFKSHLYSCFSTTIVPCAYCSFKSSKTTLVSHYASSHLLRNETSQFTCDNCDEKFATLALAKDHLKSAHGVTNYTVSTRYCNGETLCFVREKYTRRKRSMGSAEKVGTPPAKITKFGPQDINQLPINPIFDDHVCCSICEFKTKVRLNMVRHLQLHASMQPVAKTAPVNPVPHLESNEKHFDKMVNLASSSLVSRAGNKGDKNDNPVVTVLVSPEMALRYPKYVPERQRNTCGAKGCTYTSVDESMLKCHWETLHNGSNDFLCVHCPPYQTIDKSKPLSASRIMAHLKMHDVRLYACSVCTYYHYKRQVVEKHMNDFHSGGSVLVVREEIVSSPVNQTTSAGSAPAPTMDLKAWQCGLCEYKSLLRPEVAEHCAKVHQSKMRYKCAYCAFRTSNEENISKHQAKSHEGKPEETFYFYYREGTFPDEPDGTPFWQKQKNKLVDAGVKKELSPEPISQAASMEVSASQSLPQNTTTTVVDLNIVKTELSDSDHNIEELFKLYGQFCEPNGLKYKCSLCKNVIEDTKEAMQSHLFEELQYRKWGCGICFYKAFHRQGLSEHMQTEHCQNREPVKLQVDAKIETWVSKFLEYQETIIQKNKEKLAQQKAEILASTPGRALQKQTVTTPPSEMSPISKISNKSLEEKFGPLGFARNTSYCCPKCNILVKEENEMRNHLEIELNKIRWRCSVCPGTYQSYHEAQFHCKTHVGQSARPIEAPRDTLVRTAWVNAVLDAQRQCVNASMEFEREKEAETIARQHEPENSLLVVRYEERVPTPEGSVIQKRSAPDSEDERLVIDEPIKGKQKRKILSCSYCNYGSTSAKYFNDHVLRHYDLQPYTCGYCKVTGTTKLLSRHQKILHPALPLNIKSTAVPSETPEEYAKNIKSSNFLICLNCQTHLVEADAVNHMHKNLRPEFGKIGDVVVKCSTCQTLHKNINSFLNHNKLFHPNDGNYVFYKLAFDNRQTQFSCAYCPRKFPLKKDLKAHIESLHVVELNSAYFETAGPSSTSNVIILDDNSSNADMSPKRKVARKSTTKLPLSAIARKSTTKLPFSAPNEEGEFSFYGTEPSTEGLEHVTTLMPFYNSFMPVTYTKLTEIINLKPRVIVHKLKSDLLNGSVMETSDY